VRHFPIPDTSTLDRDHALGNVRWSSDGKDLFVRVVGEHEEYYQLSPVNGAFTAVEGSYDSSENALGIVRDGQSILLPMPRLAAYNDARMLTYPEPGGRLAQFDEHKVLRVLDRQGGAQVVARGDEDDPCGSAIHGWLEGDRYLLYLLDENSYVLDVATGRSAPLFGPEQAEQVRSFYW
jgi:hypothetical protein